MATKIEYRVLHNSNLYEIAAQFGAGIELEEWHEPTFQGDATEYLFGRLLIPTHKGLVPAQIGDAVYRFGDVVGVASEEDVVEFVTSFNGRSNND